MDVSPTEMSNGADRAAFLRELAIFRYYVLIPVTLPLRASATAARAQSGNGSKYLDTSQCVEFLPCAPQGAVVGRILNAVFALGSGKSVCADVSGDVFLRINEGDLVTKSDDGILIVQVSILREPSTRNIERERAVLNRFRRGISPHITLGQPQVRFRRD
jgi:hypothetical protein